MPRIDQDDLEKLKLLTSLEDLVRSEGIDLKRHGQDLIGHCPFQNDKTPSLVISPSKNLWNCLGACGEGGSVIDWVMKTKNVSFRRAFDLLRNESQNPSPDLAASNWSRDKQELLNQITTYYHAQLRHHPAAQNYLKHRGLDDAELISHFQIGVSDRTLGYRLPLKNRKAGSEMRGLLQDIGILKVTGHEHFRGCLTIPIQDKEQNVQNLYGRRIGKVDSKRREQVPHLYLPGARRGVFNPQAITASEELILCESLLDALTFWRWGFRNVTTSYGIQGFTDELKTAIENNTKRLFIAYDHDEGGQRASTSLAAKLKPLECFRVMLPQGQDVNGFAIESESPKAALKKALSDSVWMGEGADPRAKVTVQAPPKSTEESESKPTHAEVDEHEIRFTFGDRKWRVRGLQNNTRLDTLKINLQVRRHELFFVDTLDIYAAKFRTNYIRQAAEDLECETRILKRDIGLILRELELLHEQALNPSATPEDTAPKMTDSEKEEALLLLQDPSLLKRVVEDLGKLALVGEEENKLLAYLAMSSRKLDKPLAVIIQSSSAAGKSTLMDAVMRFIPKEDRIQYSAMTGQSLFYMGELNLKHKVLAIAEEAGAEKAAYALKLLQSDGELRIASTTKDQQSGRLITEEYHVEGPVMLVLTTTAIDVDEELLNRCLVLTVDESAQQTSSILTSQRASQTLEGLLQKKNQSRLETLHQNAQRLLEPVMVVNPFAPKLSFESQSTRMRRDHMKYLTLIQTIAFVHQHQRKKKTIQHHGETLEYIEVTEEDIKLADEICETMFKRRDEELPPQTQKLLAFLKGWVKEQAEKNEMEPGSLFFSRRDVRKETKWGDTQLKVHLKRLVELEYLGVQRASHSQRHLYHLYDDNRSALGRPLVGVQSDRSESENRRHRAPQRSSARAGRPKGNLTKQAPTQINAS